MAEMDVHETLKKKVSAFPEDPGVYLMKNAASEVIYVGKAKNLRTRVLSYLQAGGELRLIEQKLHEVADIDFVITRTEKEALIAELNFIKQFQPRYNVIFRDDKRFVSIAINMNEPWPRPTIVRKEGRKGTLYFGPYKAARDAELVLRSVQKIFPLRRCNLRECRRHTRPCLYAEMGKCAGPCVENITAEAYRELLDQVILFLRGQTDELIQRLQSQMQAAVDDQRFEAAAQVRDRLRLIQKVMERQYVGSVESKPNRDVFGMTVMDQRVYLSLLALRSGNMQDIGHFSFPANVDTLEEALTSYITQFYQSQSFVPDEVILPMELPEQDLVAEVLSERRGRKVLVIHPQRGERRRLLELANENSQRSQEVSLAADDATQKSLKSVQELLGLPELPRRIECFDISTLQGRKSVGAMSVVVDGRAARDQYRRYRIKGVVGQDDFAMVREVLGRRVRRGKEEENLPDLVLIDGGRGQLSAARQTLEELEMEDLPIAALAKERRRKGEKVRQERVFLPDRPQPLILDPATSAFRILTRARDEAHRFAIAYHRKLRSRPLKRSVLEEIPGVGPTLRKALMRHFGNIQAIREAPLDSLQDVAGLGEAKARRIREYFQHEKPGADDDG